MCLLGLFAQRREPTLRKKKTLARMTMAAGTRTVSNSRKQRRLLFNSLSGHDLKPIYFMFRKAEKLWGIGGFSKSMDFDQIEDADQNCSIEEATFDQSIY
jgi:hypothetical protein